MERNSVVEILRGFKVFVFILLMFGEYTVGMKQPLDNALNNICQYVEEKYLEDNINKQVYAQNMEEYTIRLLTQVEYEATESIMSEEYEISFQKLEIAEKYLETCTKIIYEYDFQDEKIVGAYQNAYRLYITAKKYIEN